MPAGRTDRREHMVSLLESVGFQRPKFPDVHVNVNVEDLVNSGRVSPAAIEAIVDRKDKGVFAVGAYIAHALSILDTLRAAVDAELDWFMLAEDDLMPATSLEEVTIVVRRHLRVFSIHTR